MSIFQGDVVDVMFRKNLHLRAVYIVTGFDRDEERAGNDRLVSGQLSVASDLDCRLWQPIRYEAISTFCQEKTKTGQTFMLGCCKNVGQVWTNGAKWRAMPALLAAPTTTAI